jgi:hypothetical protein
MQLTHISVIPLSLSYQTYFTLTFHYESVYQEAPSKPLSCLHITNINQYQTSVVCFLPGTTITLAVYFCWIFTLPCVFPPRHYHYTEVYFWSPCTIPSMFSPRHYLHTSLFLLNIYFTLCVSSQALPLHCSLFLVIYYSLCFLPGTTIILQSISGHHVLFPGTTITLNSVSGHHVLFPVCFLSGTIFTL